MFPEEVLPLPRRQELPRLFPDLFQQGRHLFRFQGGEGGVQLLRRHQFLLAPGVQDALHIRAVGLLPDRGHTDPDAAQAPLVLQDHFLHQLAGGLGQLLFPLGVLGKAEQHLVRLGGLPQLGGVLFQLPGQIGQPLQVGVYLLPIGGAEEVPGLFGGGPGPFSFFCLALHLILVGEKQVLLFAGLPR